VFAWLHGLSVFFQVRRRHRIALSAQPAQRAAARPSLVPRWTRGNRCQRAGVEAASCNLKQGIMPRIAPTLTRYTRVTYTLHWYT
jgi:hypothetical protein